MALTVLVPRITFASTGRLQFYSKHFPSDCILNNQILFIRMASRTCEIGREQMHSSLVIGCEFGGAFQAHVELHRHPHLVCPQFYPWSID